MQGIILLFWNPIFINMFQVVSGLSNLNLTSSSNNTFSSSNSSSSSNNSTFFKSVFLEKLDDKDIIESTPVDEPTVVERVIRGNDCEFIKICDVTSNTGCSDGKYSIMKVYVSQHILINSVGNKLVLKKKTGLRRQFLLLNGSPVLGFVQRKKKFTSCGSYTDITAQVDCKVGYISD